jgi:hypothetical protein
MPHVHSPELHIHPQPGYLFSMGTIKSPTSKAIREVNIHQDPASLSCACDDLSLVTVVAVTL